MTNVIEPGLYISKKERLFCLRVSGGHVINVVFKPGDPIVVLKPCDNEFTTRAVVMAGDEVGDMLLWCHEFFEVFEHV